MGETKYIFVTGGVASSLGKGIISSSIGKLLQARGYKVTIQKFDPYINIDPGTLNPYEHGECYVTVDGHEADLDLGHYERFLGIQTTKANNITTGRIYKSVIDKERRGDYLGKTIQIIPHITDEIKRNVKLLGNKYKFDFVITEIGGTVGLAASLLALHTGDSSAYMVAQSQPMKLAAMEALYDGGHGEGLTLVALVNPFKQPDYSSGVEPPMRIAMPKMLSFLATRDFDGYVPGINDIIKGGYTQADGSKAAPLEEKMERGRTAIAALADYREAKLEKDNEAAMKHRERLDENMKYFGYGYIDNAEQTVPFIPVCFWAFRVMVGLGMLFLLFFAVSVFLSYKKDIAGMRWYQAAGMALLPLGYIASEAGWIVAEFGRQPWTIQDMLPTWAAVSDVGAGSVMLTFFIFLALFTLLLAVEINIMCKAVKKGPEYGEE